MKKPEKIKLMIARALMHDEYLRDFSGQVHANECVFSYPDSDWYGVYLLDKKDNPVWGEDGAKKMYFKLEYQLDDEGLPKDASIKQKTITFEPPDELLKDGQEIKGCIVTPSGKCGNPESKRKKKSTVNPEDFEDSDDEDTPSNILQGLQGTPGVGATGKKKMPRDYFEKLGSKSLIIDWMLANMKPAEIFKCIERGNLSSEDVAQAQEILGTAGGGGGGPSGSVAGMIGQLSGSSSMVTKEQIMAAAKRIKNPEQRKKAIVGMCKRARINKYRYKPGRNGKPGMIIDDDDDFVEEGVALEECAEKEAKRIKNMMKIQSISSSLKGMTKKKLFTYEGGNTPLPYSMMTFVRKLFPPPLIKDYQDHNGLLYGKIQSEMDPGGTIYYYKLGDILGKDLKALHERTKGQIEGMKKMLFTYEGGNTPLPYSMLAQVKSVFPPPFIKEYTNRDGLLYGKIQSGVEDGTVYYYKLGDILGNDLKSLDKRISAGTVSFGKRRGTGFGKRRGAVKKVSTLRKDLKSVSKC